MLQRIDFKAGAYTHQNISSVRLGRVQAPLRIWIQKLEGSVPQAGRGVPSGHRCCEYVLGQQFPRRPFAVCRDDEPVQIAILSVVLSSCRRESMSEVGSMPKNELRPRGSSRLCLSDLSRNECTSSPLHHTIWGLSLVMFHESHCGGETVCSSIVKDHQCSGRLPLTVQCLPAKHFRASKSLADSGTACLTALLIYWACLSDHISVSRHRIHANFGR